jgi:putative nucleotidyltransferase with HDIG domain
MKSRSVKDYFEADLGDLRSEETLPFSVHLYFKKNNHLILLYRSGDAPPADMLKRYTTRGILKIWILQEEQELFKSYVAPKVQEAEKVATPEEAAPPAPINPDPLPTLESPPTPQVSAAAPTAPKTVQGKKITETLKAPELDDKKKAAIVAKEARDLIADIGKAADSIEEQKKALEAAKNVLQDVLSSTLSDTRSVLAEVWKAAELEPDFNHAIHVATYASLIAMASGRASPEVIADIALAGILHDVGLAQIPVEIVIQDWKSMSRADASIYEQHSVKGANLLESIHPNLPKRVKDIILQHHEKFDGTGYPSRLEGFKLNDLAQLVSVADLLDSICSGRFDGTPRTLDETFETLEKIEKNRTFPEYFNPEVFAMVMKWFKSGAAANYKDEAASIVQKETAKLLHEKKSA